MGEQLRNDRSEQIPTQDPDHVSLLDNLTTAVITLDHRLRIQYLNPSAEVLLAISGNRSKGTCISEYFRNPGKMESFLDATLRTNQAYTNRKTELTLINGTELTVDYTVTPVIEATHKMLMMEVRLVDHLLRIDRDEAVRVHQATTREMIRGLAHEIKNPLGGIRGAAQLLAAELPDEELADYTNIIIEETDRLRKLVDRLLGPNTMLQRCDTNIHEVLERVCTLIEVESNHQISIQRDYDPSIPDMHADGELLLQALLNIVRNAMLAVMDSATSSRISLVTRTERQFTIGTTRHRLVVRVDVTDDGPGIPDALRQHLFYPMISGRAKGTGLGLSVALAIINQHRGLIEFESEPGNTTFSLLIPLELTDAASS
jgi:two-component system nitrogen regulation sensor histidine kinase GlnL|tara:strand:- start:4395 stop:5513 length:1119 start_codon:yes stop_codon:yes gene_type:complete